MLHNFLKNLHDSHILTMPLVHRAMIHCLSLPVLARMLMDAAWATENFPVFYKKNNAITVNVVIALSLFVIGLCTTEST